MIKVYRRRPSGLFLRKGGVLPHINTSTPNLNALILVEPLYPRAGTYGVTCARSRHGGTCVPRPPRQPGPARHGASRSLAGRRLGPGAGTPASCRAEPRLISSWSIRLGSLNPTRRSVRSRGDPMSWTTTDWRTTALTMLPDLAKEIEEAETPYLLWFELYGTFRGAYAPPRNE